MPVGHAFAAESSESAEDSEDAAVWGMGDIRQMAVQLELELAAAEELGQLEDGLAGLGLSEEGRGRQLHVSAAEVSEPHSVAAHSAGIRAWLAQEELLGPHKLTPNTVVRHQRTLPTLSPCCRTLSRMTAQARIFARTVLGPDVEDVEEYMKVRAGCLR